MNCPHCHQPLPDPAAATCPHCGQPLTSAAEQDPLAGPTVLQGAPGSADETPTFFRERPLASQSVPHGISRPAETRNPPGPHGTSRSRTRRTRSPIRHPQTHHPGPRRRLRCRARICRQSSSSRSYRPQPINSRRRLPIHRRLRQRRRLRSRLRMLHPRNQRNRLLIPHQPIRHQSKGRQPIRPRRTISRRHPRMGFHSSPPMARRPHNRATRRGIPPRLASHGPARCRLRRNARAGRAASSVAC